MTNGSGGESQPNDSSSRYKEVAGAFVASVGLVALVVIVLIATLTLPKSGKAQNVVAISSSAFGVIGAVVGAYFGIRTAKNAVDQIDKK